MQYIINRNSLSRIAELEVSMNLGLLGLAKRRLRPGVQSSMLSHRGGEKIQTTTRDIILLGITTMLVSDWSLAPHSLKLILGCLSVTSTLRSEVIDKVSTPDPKGPLHYVWSEGPWVQPQMPVGLHSRNQAHSFISKNGNSTIGNDMARSMGKSQSDAPHVCQNLTQPRHRGEHCIPGAFRFHRRQKGYEYGWDLMYDLSLTGVMA